MTDHGAMPPPSGAPVPGPSSPGGPPPWWRRRVAMLPAWAWMGLFVVGVTGSIWSLGSGGGDEGAAAPTTTIEFAVDVPPPAGTLEEDIVNTIAADASATGDTSADVASGDGAPPTSEATTAVEPTTAATTVTTAPSTTAVETTTTAPPTTAPETTTTAPPTTAPETTTTTVAPTTTPETTTTTMVPDIDLPEPVTVSGPNGEQLTIVPRRGPCRYGELCLVVGFEVSGLPRWPGIKDFVCEFSSGARYWFRFSGTSVETACSSADIPESITVTVAGIRSEMVFIEH